MLGFSSAQSVVAEMQAYALPDAGVEVEDRAAFSAKRGSRGKIHERRCHGLIAPVTATATRSRR